MCQREFLLLVATIFAISACALAPHDARDSSAVRDIQHELEAAANPAPNPVIAPDSVVDALLPSLSGGDVSAEDERFDVSVKNVAAKSFFEGLVRGTNHNVVVHPDVSGKISLNLSDVTIEEVLDVVRDIYGYPYKKTGNLYQVMSAGLRSEVFQIDYLSLRRNGLSETQVSAGEVSDAGSSSTGSNSSSNNISNNSNSNNNNSNGSSNNRLVGTQIITSTESDFWKELEETLSVLIGQGEGRRVVITPQAGIIVIRANPSELDVARDYLMRAELVMRRQVVLEAKILEVQLSDGFQSGINWTAIANSGDDSYSFGPSGSSVVNPSGNGGVFGITFDIGSDFLGIVELLETQGTVQVLSSPRISTVNNQKAVIKVGTDEFFVTEVSNSVTVTNGSTTNSPDVELTPFFSGIALDVTPQISDQEEIILHIHPTISEVVDQTKIISLGDSDFELPLALSTIRETDSIVFAKSGQVVVLGGLMQDKLVDDNAGLPGIGKLPIIGHFFNQQRNSSVKSELVILLKPMIMGPDGSTQSVQESIRRVENFRKQFDASYRGKNN